MTLYVIIVVIVIQIVFDRSDILYNRFCFKQRTRCFLFFLLLFVMIRKHCCFFSFKMTDHFFQSVNPLWYLACDGGLLQLAILTFWPNITPYEYLGLFGQFMRYLAFNQHILLVIVFSISIFLHIFEAILARQLCRKLNIDSKTSQKWFIQTLLLGYVSLGKLRKYAAKKDRKL